MFDIDSGYPVVDLVAEQLGKYCYTAGPAKDNLTVAAEDNSVVKILQLWLMAGKAGLTSEMMAETVVVAVGLQKK